MAVTGHLGGTLTFTQPGDVFLIKAFVKYMRWVGVQGQVANDQLLMVDENGDTVFRSIADGAYFIDMLPLYKWINEMHLTTISSGVLDVVTV